MKTNNTENKNGSFIKNIKFVNFDGKVLVMWAFIGSIMFYFARVLLDDSLLKTVLFVLFGFVIGFLIKFILLKKANKKDNLNILEVLTNRIFIYNTVSLIFAFLLSVIMLKINASAMVFPIFLFSIYMPRFIIGTLANCNACKLTSTNGMLVAIVMFVYIIIFPEYINNSLVIDIISYISIFVFFFLFLILGISKINRTE